MISQSEIAPVLDCFEERMVAPLEFHVLETIEEADKAYVMTPAAESEARWKEQVAALEEKLEFELESARARIEATRREAEVETRDELSSEMERRIGVERAEVAKVVTQFGRERERYFAEIEAEVVRLSLAIAARLMHREAALDPLLLRATVRVALDKVAGESGVRLHVAEGQAERWREMFAAEHGGDAVAVIEDRQLASPDVVLETSVGRVELGVSAQLKEIERGFFDLLEKRPA